MTTISHFDAFLYPQKGVTDVRRVALAGILPKPLKYGKNRGLLFPRKSPFRVALHRGSHYNAHAINRLAWKRFHHMRHPRRNLPMEVAFLMPEA
jgi:hypothetical protein